MHSSCRCKKQNSACITECILFQEKPRIRMTIYLCTMQHTVDRVRCNFYSCIACTIKCICVVHSNTVGLCRISPVWAASLSSCWESCISSWTLRAGGAANPSFTQVSTQGRWHRGTLLRHQGTKQCVTIQRAKLVKTG